MRSEWVLFSWTVLQLVIVVLLPMIPAILIYKIFPNTQIAAQGAIKALKWNSSGAFAGYMIILCAIIASPLNRIFDSIGTLYHPTWTVEMEIHGYDSDDRQTTFGDLGVTLEPGLHRVSPNQIQLRIPGLSRSDWPVAHIHAQGAAAQVHLATLEEDELEIDEINKTITVLSPVIVKQVGTVGAHYPAPGSEYINNPEET
ncbi:MAG: hypothetical protein DHS20C11_11490 [Lysobacteraceae bacterium]|nr:MAG: hypothetical protein DHS20C11_11490 [Xanthomonadaceae bacterium]